MLYKFKFKSPNWIYKIFRKDVYKYFSDTDIDRLLTLKETDECFPYIKEKFSEYIVSNLIDIDEKNPFLKNNSPEELANNIVMRFWRTFRVRKVKQVIVVRKDLNMRKGKIASQVAHASLGAILKLMKKEYHPNELSSGKTIYSMTFYNDFANPVKKWLEEKFTKICVYVESEEELLKLHKEVSGHGILNCLIKDAGDTEFHGVPTYTTLAIGPDYGDNIDKFTGHLKLL